MRYLDPRLSRLLAEQMVAEARRASRPAGGSHQHPSKRLHERGRAWLFAVAKKVYGRLVRPAVRVSHDSPDSVG